MKCFFFERCCYNLKEVVVLKFLFLLLLVFYSSVLCLVLVLEGDVIESWLTDV